MGKNLTEGKEFAACPKCRTAFERPAFRIRPNHPGFSCPQCRMFGFGIIGIVHFIPDVDLGIMPDIMTA